MLAAELAAARLTATTDLENCALPAVAWMGRCGVLVDRTAWEALAVTAEAEAIRLAGEMDALVPPPAGRGIGGAPPR